MLRAERTIFALLQPRYVSVTCGAGGSARGGTFELVKALRHESDVDVVPHITCVGASRAAIRELLAAYAAIGIRRVLALRGDLPQREAPLDFLHASDLVAFIRSEMGCSFSVAREARDGSRATTSATVTTTRLSRRP